MRAELACSARMHRAGELINKLYVFETHEFFKVSYSVGN